MVKEGGYSIAGRLTFCSALASAPWIGCPARILLQSITNKYYTLEVAHSLLMVKEGGYTIAVRSPSDLPIQLGHHATRTYA